MQETEDKFRKNLDELRLENSLLRGHIMKKTVEITNYQSLLRVINKREKPSRCSTAALKGLTKGNVVSEDLMEENKRISVPVTKQETKES